MSALPTVELDAAAATVLTTAWIWRWTLILGLGSFPWWWARWRRLDRASASLREVRGWAHTLAFALCLLSGNLVLDTFGWEARAANRYQLAPCTVVARQALGLFTRYECRDETAYYAYQSLPLRLGETYAVTALPHTRAVVAAQVCSGTDCPAGPTDWPAGPASAPAVPPAPG